jgi:predicted amidohydrolase YtcJ
MVTARLQPVPFPHFRGGDLRQICGVLSLLLFLLAARGFAQSADFIFTGGVIWTGDSLRPRAEAVAVRGDRITAVGKSSAVAELTGPGTKVIDLAGRTLLPGFVDNHVHFMAGGFQLQNVDLRDARDEREFAERLADRARNHPGRWVTGGDWDHDNWPGARLPTRHMIDSLTGETPVFVSRYDGHMALANTVVLKRAGITRDTPDPAGGAIVRDPLTGEPTGILKDEAMTRVWALVPDASEDEKIEAAELALAEARHNGVTSLQDISSFEDVRIYRRLHDEGRLTARMYCRLPVGSWEQLAHDGVRAGDGDLWIRLGSLKAFADGSLGSSTALFYEPYDSEPSTRGLPSDIVIDGRLREWARAADRAGLQLSIHAIGDSANSLVLDLFEEIVRTNPPWDRRFRIEHAKHIHPKDFTRFARLNVIASVQPYHAIDDGRWAEGRIGKKRCRTTYPFRTFLENRVPVCFGSDWTVAPLKPVLGIYAAVTRRTTDGKNPDGWIPEEKVSLEEALRAFTSAGAYAEFGENEKGTLTPGKLADIVVMSMNIFAIPPERLADASVDLTMVGGRIVYDRSNDPKKEP